MLQALILAAGLGRRLGKLTEQSTKCMVDVNGRRLVEYALDALAEVPVERVIMVVGHGAEEVKSFLGQSYRGIPIQYIFNPDYAATNNLYSLFLARANLESADTLLLESDVIFDPALAVECARHPEPDVAVVSPLEPGMEGTVVILDEHERISRFVLGPERIHADNARYHKTVNMYKLSARFSRTLLVPALVRYVDAGRVDEYYEEVFRLLIQSGGQLSALPTGENAWYEVDDAHDLDVACTLFADPSNRPAAFHARFGGYWRFPKLRDFCYLVNSHFPSAEFVDEIASQLPVLLRQYPSGLNVQCALAARLFDCDPSSMLVGNGASELIRACMAALAGKIAVPVPTFEEYPHAVGADRLVEIPARGAALRHLVEDLLDACRVPQVTTLVLTNPNNPTGQFVPRDTVVALANGLASMNVRLILDESFVDFVDGSGAHTCLNNALLAAHRNLIVVKSLSKSFGVPGLRLGVMASSDHEFLREVRAHLPIWNINALGEYFLQCFPRYRAAYHAACVQVVNDRAHLLSELATSGIVRPLDSAANFILCTVRDTTSVSALGQTLLNDHWILVKDCAGKRGFGDVSYIRVAVRTRTENDYLLAAITRLEESRS